MSGIQTTENAASQRGDLEEKREVGMKVSLGERVGKIVNPQRERERERERAPAAGTIFAKVQSSGTDRKVKINQRSEFFTTFSSSAAAETHRVSPWPPQAPFESFQRGSKLVVLTGERERNANFEHFPQN